MLALEYQDKTVCYGTQGSVSVRTNNAISQQLTVGLRFQWASLTRKQSHKNKLQFRFSGFLQ